MNLAPQPQLRATLRHYASGMRGVAQTIGVMRSLVNEGRIDPTIRQAATSIIFLAPEKADQIEVSKLLDFVQTTIRYTKDINGVETISSAEKTLSGRIGDCDDQSVLLAALCEAVGYPTRFVVAGYEYADVMEHVFVQICVAGEWCDADPTERGPLGWSPPDALRSYVERV